MNKVDAVRAVLAARINNSPLSSSVSVFAPTNIALCKYWGKRDQELNLPVTSSLSISLGDKGASTVIRVLAESSDYIILNGKQMSVDTPFSKRLIDFVNLFRKPHEKFEVIIDANIPIAAGLASSAAGFASVTKALNELYQWNLSKKELSILARLGSGSATRSLWDGFVEWRAGLCADGMDSYGEYLASNWPELCIGLLLVSKKEKEISSRDAMRHTIETSAAFQLWPKRADKDLLTLKQAICKKDFAILGKTAESNALMMHAMMLTASPPIQYSTPATLVLMQKIWRLRSEGLAIYFTQDAGPNLKLLFLEENVSDVVQNFPEMEVIRPFSKLL